MVQSKCSSTNMKKPNTNRYKGVENFLRRIAFNLGNTPSKTDVKVISCIPIDVTDLQQKILSLEKRLEKARCERPCADRKKAVAPVVVNRVGADSASPDTRPSRLSETSYYYPRRNKHKTPDLSLYLRDPAQYRLKQSPSRQALHNESRNVFGRVIPERDRTQLVYYAQTAGSPFTNYKKANDTCKENFDEAMDREYLSSLVERQHLVKMYMDDDMLGSQGSAPVCRDLPRCSGTSEDMCSCCHGHFLDVDCKIRKRLDHNPNIDSGNIYYDSSLYDVRPVKEKPVKNSELARKLAPEIDLTFLPEYYRFKPEYSLNMDSMPHAAHRCGKKLIQKNPCAKPVFLPNESSVTDGLVEFSHVYPKRLSPKQELKNYANNMSKNAQCNACSDNSEYHTRANKPNQSLSATQLESTSNHFRKPISEKVYRAEAMSKALQTSLSKLGSTLNGIKVTLQNSAHPMNEIECQTDSSSPSQPDKTESTLNQIKAMLETVLIEVKTTSGVRTVVSEKETKDATVQNEQGQTSECERLLNSFTYSPYTMLNPYMPPCSRALPSYCSSMMRQTLTMPRHEVLPTDLTCMANYPEMLHQTVAAHSCFPERNVMQPKVTSTCGTNTLRDPPKRRNTETENLIKEIYKSIKLDVDYPMKSTSRDAMDASKADEVCEASPEVKTMRGREEIVFRGDVGTSRAARLGSPSSQLSMSRPQRRGGSLHQQPKHSTSAQRRQCVCKGTNKDSHASDSDSETDIDLGQSSASPDKSPMKPAKKGFFGKVMSSVVKRMRKKEEQPPQNLEKCTTVFMQDSESSDNETPFVPKERPVKRVSYAPGAPQPWRDPLPRPATTTSKTRRLSHAPYRRPERPIHQAQRMPRYVPPRPRSVLRPHAGSSQIRRTLYRPQAPNRPRTPPEYMKRVPHNQYDWRTTPTRSAHRMAPISANEYKPRVPTKSQGLKITNKSWMRKPVYHLGFACGPEKERIMMQY